MKNFKFNSNANGRHDAISALLTYGSCRGKHGNDTATTRQRHGNGLHRFRIVTLLLLLLTLGVGQMWAASGTIYVTPANMWGSDWDYSTSKIKIAYNYNSSEGDKWTGEQDMTKTAYTFHNYPVYSYTLSSSTNYAKIFVYHYKNSTKQTTYNVGGDEWIDFSGCLNKMYNGWHNSAHEWLATSQFDANTEVTVYYAYQNTNDYTIKANMRISNDYDVWRTYTMTSTGHMIGNKTIYECTFNDYREHLYVLQFQRHDGSSFVSQDQPINNSWTAMSTYGSKMYNGSSWVAYQYDVTLDQQSGSGGTSSITATCGSAMPGSKTAPSRTGYTFGGYYTEEDGGGTQYYTSAMASDRNWPSDGTGPNTLYAKWTAKTTAVTLNANAPGGQTVTGGGTIVTATYGSTLPTFSALTCTGGYALKGYYTETSGGTKVIDAEGSFTSNSGKWNRTDGASLALYAQWSLDRTLTYSGNENTGGSVPASPTVYANGASATVLGNTNSLVKTGYTFTGWNTSADGNGVDYSAGSTITMNANYTLYAQWEEDIHTVNITGGTAASTSAGVSTTGTATVSLPAGKKFTGWELGTGVTLVTGTASSTTITFHASQTSTVTATFADRAQVKMYFAKPPVWGASTLYVHTFKNGGGADPNAAYPGVTMSTTETINCVTYYTYQYYTEGDGIGGAATGNSAWDRVIFGCNTDAKKTGDLTISNGHYYYWNSSTTGAASAVTDVWYIKGTMNDWGTTHPIVHDCANHKGTVNINLTASTTYEFKVYDVVNTYMWSNSTACGTLSGDHTITATMASAETLYNDDVNVMKVTANVTGPYTFEVSNTNTTSPKIKVTFPVSYTLTYSIGSIAGNNGSISTSPTTSSGSRVLSGNSVTLTAPAAKTGYTWKGWYTNAAGTTGKIDDTNRAITVTMNADKTLYACYTENMTTVNLVASPTGKGTFTSGGGAVTSVSAGVTTHPSVTAVAATGYRVNTSTTVWSESSDYISLSSTTTNPTTITATGTTGNSATLTATFTPITYTIKFNGNGATSGSMSDQTGVTYDAATIITSNAFVKTGYNFAGWATSAGGEVVRADGAAHGNLSSTQGATVNLYAKWTPKQSAVTLDYQTSATGYSSSGNISNTVGLTGTYGSAMTALTGTMPSAANGYAFMGFYSATGGNGTKYYNADGSSETSWAENTESGTTLYAYYKKAEITALTLDAATVEPGNTIGVTPTISPTPTGTTIICWEVRYSNDNPLSPQPETTWSDGKLTFDAPAASGIYKIVATLKTGNDCAGGTELSTTSVNVQVAGSHTVTLQYKCGDDAIAASVEMTARPLVWSDGISAPDIFGYSFSSWSAGDGITITDNDGATSGTSSSNATIKIKATYNGTLTANYTPKKLIYFKNTLGWSNVYVNFYKSDYWNSDKGSGNNGVPVQNKTMTRLGETDIWYYDYGSDDFTGYTNTKPTNYVSFTSATQSSAVNFWASGTGISVSYPARRSDDLADKSGETGFYESTPMFVPLAGQSAITKNNSGGGKALYYNSGYWTKYLPGTGYTLEIYNAAGNSKIKEIDFSSADELMPMKAVVDLEANTTYKFQIKRHGDVYLGNSGSMSYANHGQATPWEMTSTDFSMCGIATTAAGDYTFNFTYSANASNQYRLRISVDYPVANGDYRLIYTDNTRNSGTRYKPSAIISKENNGSAIVSFFVRPSSTPVLRMQQASVDGSGNITWNEYPTSGTPTNQITGDIASAIESTGVYNFNLSMNGSGALSVTSAEAYTGNYYIRTDAANSKWDNYRTDPDHLMTYSEYSITHGGYSHYYTHWVNKDDAGRKNVKFVIANDYSPCISDTLARETASGTWAHIADWMEEGGDLKRSANVRFMWDIATNAISRAYVDGAQEDGSEFLLMLNTDSPNKIKWADGTALTSNKVTFSDNGNWIYEANIKAQPNAKIKLKSTWGNTGNAIVQYFKGTSSEDETLIGGSGTDWYDFRLIYDFKTNRLVTSYIPSGNISNELAINADVMFIREHQGDIAQLTFSKANEESPMGSISAINTAYGVMRFNKWTINNKDKSTHEPLGTKLSRFERDIFYISFPFRVNLEEVFGFGTYGTHWIMEEYDGAGRAEKGYWADSESFWSFITDRKGKFLEPNKGYILALDLDELGESSSVWTNTDVVELYFPSYGTMPTITSSSVTHELPAHTCTIGPRPGMSDDRRVKDSHWNVMSVPTYVNTSDVSFANTTWITTGDGRLGPNFLYEWNKGDNTLTARSGSGYTYHAMHAYMVQYCGNVTWTTSVSPASVVARQKDVPTNVEFRMEIQQGEQTADQAFVRMTTDDNVTTGFEFNYDLSKEFNKNKANIYTMITSVIDSETSVTEAAANVLPMSEQTTIVPVGVKIATNDDYTFSIPDGTSGVGVTLIDKLTGTRTNISAVDYTVSLEAGTYNERFVLEISPIEQVITNLEPSAMEQQSDVRKLLIDGLLYIVRDGKVYDARGAKVK